MLILKWFQNVKTGLLKHYVKVPADHMKTGCEKELKRNYFLLTFDVQRSGHLALHKMVEFGDAFNHGRYKQIYFDYHEHLRNKTISQK